jgi:hypothetical protein
MQRREFLAAAATTAAAGLLAGRVSAAADAPISGREIYDLRTYHFATAAKMEAFEKFLAEAAIPACNRAGIEPVGVFKRLAKDNAAAKLETDPAELWVLLPHHSLESVITLEDRLSADAVFQKAGEAILTATKADPAFARYENMLLLAMEKAPKLTVPSKAAGRLFELRTYESRSQERAKNKLEMFNAGEFAFFEQAGMHGVFYGGAFAGSDLPQLTYMIVHENENDVKKHWSNFSAIPGWNTLKAGPSYKDNVSKIIDRFLRPAAGSQI